MKNHILITVILFLGIFINTSAQRRCGSEFNLQTIKQIEPACYERIMQLEQQVIEFSNERGNTEYCNYNPICSGCVAKIGMIEGFNLKGESLIKR